MDRWILKQQILHAQAELLKVAQMLGNTLECESQCKPQQHCCRCPSCCKAMVDACGCKE